MIEFADICVKRMIAYDRDLSQEERKAVIRYFFTYDMTIKEYADFRIKEMPFF